jgi:hypothetical protein
MEITNKLVNAIAEYETKFNGNLKSGYKDNKEFLNDLTNEIESDGTVEILEYYKIDLVSRNNTNSTEERRLALRNLITLLD